MSRSRIIALSILLFALLPACGGKPFNIKSKPDLPPREPGIKAVAGGLTVQAEAVTDEDFLYETFDANLILAGVLPVRITVSSAEQEPVDLRKAKFEIRTAAGRAYKAINANSAFKRLISYYGISTYTKEGYKQSQSDFASHALDLQSPLAPGGSRQGMIFFHIADEAARTASMTLAAERLDAKRQKSNSSVELKLN
jgi:hypothetical protein